MRNRTWLRSDLLAALCRRWAVDDADGRAVWSRFTRGERGGELPVTATGTRRIHGAASS